MKGLLGGTKPISKLPLYTSTLTLSPPPRFNEAFILVLKERSGRHYGRDKQQHAQQHTQQHIVNHHCLSDYSVVQLIVHVGAGCCWMSNNIRYEYLKCTRGRS